MAAADYYKAVRAPSSMRTYEEKLEIQAQDIEQKTLLFQARLRGFLIRHRVSRHHKVDVAIENTGHLASMKRGSYRDTHSITSEMDERWNSNTNKIIAENDEHGDKYTQRDNIHAHDLWHQITLGKAESLDLQARYQQPINSAADDSECDNDYSKVDKTTDDILSR